MQTPINKGDIVKILPKPANCDTQGPYWVGDMDDLVGEEYTVTAVMFRSNGNFQVMVQRFWFLSEWVELVHQSQSDAEETDKDSDYDRAMRVLE